MFDMSGGLIILCIIGIICLFGCFTLGVYHEYCTEDIHHYYKIIDKRIEKGYGSDMIIVTTNGEYSVLYRDYKDTNINDTFDVITSPDGHYKSYKIIKDDRNCINQIKKKSKY